jgi:large subunit ribosomal protein L10
VFLLFAEKDPLSQEVTMALRLEDKKTLVAEVNEVAANAFSAVVAEYRGLTVMQMTELRKTARESGVYMRVVKNTLARRAIQGTEFECLNEAIKGPLLLAFSQEDPGAAARVVKKFAEDNHKLVTVGLAISGNLLPASDLDRLASLPNREQALAMLAGLIQAPITKLVRTLVEPHTKLVRSIAAVRDRKQAA